jgi:hypothetical protein
MAVEKKEFKFPDEQDDKKGADAEKDIEIEVVADAPEADRGRQPLPKEVVKELEDDDLEEYSDKVKKRLSQMKKVWHDERREKEAAQRERDEAARITLAKDNEIKKLRKDLGDGVKIYSDDMTKSVSAEIEAANAQLESAFEAGDPKVITAAQNKLFDAKLKLKELEFKLPKQKELAQEEKDVVERQQQHQEHRAPDPKAEAWRARNTWFGADEEMTSLALGLHQKLVRSGIDPRSDDYYRKVDETMRKRFPESFEVDDDEDEDKQTQSKGKDTKSPSRKADTVVAPATRSTAPKKVRLTETQVALAKRLGLTPQAYAKEVLKLETQNG